MAKQRNAERMAARRRAEAERNQPPRPSPDAREETPPIPVEEVAQNEMAEMETVVDQQEGQVTEYRGEKRPANHDTVYSEDPVDKRPCLEESDLVVPFIVQPKIKKNAG